MATLGPDPAPLYIQTLKEEGLDPAKFNVAQLRMVYVAESSDQAWDECQDHLWHLMTFYQDILAEANDAAGDTSPLPATNAKELRNSPAADAMLIGTPDEVGKKLEQFCQDFQCTDFIMDMQFPGLDPAKSTRSMELFAAEIMPSFKDA
jgi:alkanesulfonate monooxygenase SsuD/methylene tetrahydromethanopterin reductase-like flavin-dependent oxidoreductase (luciferase family)